MADEQGEAKMDLPKRFARRGIVIYFQIAAAVVSILLGLAQITKESQPIVQKIQENREQVALQKQQEQAQKRADEIAQMQISWQYRGNDGTWRYYSDSSKASTNTARTRNTCSQATRDHINERQKHVSSYARQGSQGHQENGLLLRDRRL
jgi:hypothetical protein